MNSRSKISGNVQEVWSKLDSRWQGEDAKAFHREYILKITETVESFEVACDELGNLSAELSKELQKIEESLLE